MAFRIAVVAPYRTRSIVNHRDARLSKASARGRYRVTPVGAREKNSSSVRMPAPWSGLSVAVDLAGVDRVRPVPVHPVHVEGRPYNREERLSPGLTPVPCQNLLDALESRRGPEVDAEHGRPPDPGTPRQHAEQVPVSFDRHHVYGAVPEDGIEAAARAGRTSPCTETPPAPPDAPSSAADSNIDRSESAQATEQPAAVRHRTQLRGGAENEAGGATAGGEARRARPPRTARCRRPMAGPAV